MDSTLQHRKERNALSKKGSKYTSERLCLCAGGSRGRACTTDQNREPVVPLGSTVRLDAPNTHTDGLAFVGIPLTRNH